MTRLLRGRAAHLLGTVALLLVAALTIPPRSAPAQDRPQRVLREAAGCATTGIAWLKQVVQQEIVTLGDRVIFVARDDGTLELFVSDGTEEGTRELANIKPLGSSRPSQLTVAGDVVFFVADDGHSGRELWRTDGTTGGTRLVRDIQAGPRGSGPVELLAVGDDVFFQADDGFNGPALWISDGTEEGTQLLHDFEAAPSGSYFGRMVTDGEVVYLVARYGPGGPQVWQSNGTRSGTLEVTRGFALGPSDPRHLAVVGGLVYFTARNDPYGRELWVTTGPRGEARLVRDIFPGERGSSIPWIYSVGDVVYFAADNGAHGLELWRSDGTEEGTRLVADVEPSPRGSAPSDVFALGNQVLFLATRNRDREMYVLDDADGPARLLKDINVGPESAFAREGFLARIEVGGRSLFVADDGISGRELWITDGTNRGTALVADLNAFGDSRGIFTDERRLGFARIGRTVYLTGPSGHGPTLWATACDSSF